MKYAVAIINYLRSRALTICVSAFIWLVCIIVYFVYNLELEPILYAMLLATVVLLPVIVVDAARYAKKLQMLAVIKRNEEMFECSLPPAINQIERDYQEVVRTLQKGNKALKLKGDLKQREITDYYSMWVHQIKTPISAAGLMLQSNPPENPSKIAAELFQIEQYVDMALNFVRLESINNDLDFKKCSLDGIINRAVKKFSRIFIMKRINLNFIETKQEVVTDEKWLGFVIEQLISNSLKYSHQGGSVKIYMGYNKILVIEDRGIGIREEDLPRIFEKGFTGYNGRLNKKSSGIGLYMCEKVMGVLAHKIQIKSSINGGTMALLSLNQINIRHE